MCVRVYVHAHGNGRSVPRRGTARVTSLLAERSLVTLRFPHVKSTANYKVHGRQRLSRACDRIFFRVSIKRLRGLATSFIVHVGLGCALRTDTSRNFSQNQRPLGRRKIFRRETSPLICITKAVALHPSASEKKKKKRRERKIKKWGRKWNARGKNVPCRRLVRF